MFRTSDTIAAIATAPGRGGIGVVRLSGPDAHAVALGLVTRQERFEPRYATFSRVHALSTRDAQPEALDHAVVTYFPAPRSYTGEDVVEVSVHGSPVVLNGLVERAVQLGEIGRAHV